MAKVEIYTKRTCGYCMMAKRLLQRKGVEYEEYSVDTDQAKWAEMSKRSNGGRTVPQIFIGNEHIGGFDDMNALDRKGGLDPLLSL